MATDESGLGDASADEPVEHVHLEPAAPASGSRGRSRLGLSLLAFALLGTAAVMPYAISLMRQAKASMITPATVPIIVVVTLLLEGAISAVTIAMGIAMGPRTGLGPFLLEGIDGAPGSDEVGTDGLTHTPRHRAWKAIGLATGTGVALGAVIVGCSYALRSSMPEMATKIEHPRLLLGLLASIGAAIREEIWLRLGFMTLLAWLGTVIARSAPGNSAVIWSANVLAALAFGAMHLPQAAMLLGLNAAVVGFVFIGNGVPGIAFGWLYWRKGLIAAMVSHFMLDLVLKVLVPALAP